MSAMKDQGLSDAASNDRVREQASARGAYIEQSAAQAATRPAAIATTLRYEASEPAMPRDALASNGVFAADRRGQGSRRETQIVSSPAG